MWQKSGHRHWRGSLWLAVLALVLPLLAAPDAVQAQYRERRTLLDLLFGGPRYIEPIEPVPTRRKITTPRAPKKTPKAAASPAAPPPPPPIVKLENARKVLVVGDFIAGGLAEGLDEAFANSAGVTVIGKSNGSSGLVREDYYNWQMELPTILDEVKPDLVVVEIGANDRQQMATQTGKEDFRTENWLKEYERRIIVLAKIVTDRKLPLLWVGMPPFRPQNMTSDALMLNGIYQKTVEAHGGEFIDVWEGFVDAEGRFILTGSDINGQQVRLRGSDGINLTAAGKRKMAFYVEKPARRHLGEMASPEFMTLDGGNLPELKSLPPSQMQNIVSTQPINMTDPDLDGGTKLLGDEPPPPAAFPSPRENLVQRGQLPPPPRGRVDDYALPQANTVLQ